MDLRHARTFVAVAELGTVSKAASQLRIAQPALSRQIGDLEHELGLKLFDRLGRRLVLTGEGEQLLAACRSLLDHADAVVERARSLRGGESGPLRVAASPQFIESVLAPFLHTYAGTFPAVDVTVIEAIGWPDVRSLLERGSVHVGQTLLRAVDEEDSHFSRLPVSAVDLLAAFHPGSALAAGDTIDIAALASHPLLLLESSFVFRRTFDAACLVAGFSPRVAFESRTPHTLLAMAESGHGIAIIPSALRIRGHDLHVAALTDQGRPLAETLAILWNSRRALPRYAREFGTMLAAYADTALPASKPFRGDRP